MAKVSVPWQQLIVEAMEAMQSYGLLLTSVDRDGKPNAMTIGWAAVGIMWARPVFVVMVRPSRYTYGCIELTGDFTVSVPYPQQRDDVTYCGTASGRDVDKFAECGFSPLNIPEIASPGIEQCAAVFFCRVIHRNDVIPPQLLPDVAQECYPADDYHRFYYGEIVEVLADPDAAERLRAAL